ncbi:sensor histidine kinase [Sphingobacterium griseoflavum]|uniref:histidine kinase n=1 Tax=Sphingobacterium griseoflavum TaxID=1474952 RepID=A0ABQ3HY69_9SPHI|nr:HAMP domain-containing sensor histidine kinase [Sphingobacterium griseoflavum]GHE46554.1 hypothetical protein GCM10017764_32210 [Sphingobacterium griseoflavum]
MLKKYKILLTLIVLTATGIAFVLLFWLFGSYKSERELFLGSAERSLFNVLQKYYQNEFAESPKRARTDSLESQRRHKGLLNLLGSVYPDLDLAPMRTFLDTADFRRGRGRRGNEGERSKEAPNELLPLYLLEKMDFNEQLLDTLEARLANTLARNGIQVKFQLSTAVIPREHFDSYIQDRKKQAFLFTRPILINPENEQFLLAKFENPWPYLGMQLGAQFFFSLLLLTALIGTFIYLLKTIKKQNQAAVLRKAFVNNMTHELKTPVSTVMAAVEALQRFVAKDDKERMHNYLEISKTELEHLNDMIERVLELDVDETHRIRLVKSTFDMIPFVRSCLEVTRIATQKNVQILFDPAVEHLVMSADEAHLKNVLGNLLDNAVKYSGDPVQISVDVKEQAGYIVLRIADKGKGIPAEHIPRIFDVFFRVPEGTVHEVKGFGLGLAYVKHVVEQHGGRIRVNSEMGKGSIFTISIPKT